MVQELYQQLRLLWENIFLVNKYCRLKSLLRKSESLKKSLNPTDSNLFYRERKSSINDLIMV